MSARGRIELATRLTMGRLAPSAILRQRLGSCVHCGLCETVCPVRLNIQEILFEGKSQLKPFPLWARTLGRAALSPENTDRAFRLARLAHALLYTPLRLQRRLRFIPRPAGTPLRRRQTLVRPPSSPRGRVALFVGCSINYLYPEVGEDLIDILVALGYEVVLARGEVCCGAPLRELGMKDVATTLARKNVERFSLLNADAILSACPTCTVTLKLQYPDMLSASSALTERIVDATVFLSEHLDRDLHAEGSVAYHDPCHLSGTLGIRQPPRALLTHTGATLLTSQTAATCCGFGGTFGFFNRDLSTRLGRKTLEGLDAPQADALVTACPGCMMQFDDLMKNRPGRRVLHVVEYIHRAMFAAERTGQD